MLRLIGCSGAAGAAPRGGAGARRGRRLARAGTRIWRPSSSLAARLIWLEVGPARRAAGALQRVLDARARRQPVDARALDRARDVDDDACRRSALCDARRCVAAGGGGAASAVGRERARYQAASSEQDQGGGGPGGQPAGIAFEHGPNLGGIGVTDL